MAGVGHAGPSAPAQVEVGTVMEAAHRRQPGGQRSRVNTLQDAQSTVSARPAQLAPPDRGAASAGPPTWGPLA